METSRPNPFIVALIACLIVCSNSVNGQVYNYAIPTSQNFETNPAVLASKRYDNRFNAVQVNSFSDDNPLSYSSLRYSKYISSAFLGLGLSLNRTQYGQDAEQYHAAFGIGYRNVLFNSVFIRIGAAYKLNRVDAAPGTFDYLLFESREPNRTSEVQHNFNASILLGDDGEKKFLSFSVLNQPFSLETDTVSLFHMPQYLAWSIGNFLSFSRSRRDLKLTYNGFAKTVDNQTIISHFAHFHFATHITRKLAALIGFRAGVLQQDQYQLSPLLTIYGEHFAVNLMYNFHPEDYPNIANTALLSFTYKI